MNNQFKNPTFGGFKPNAMQRIAGTLGYTGEMSGFQSYLEQNPDKKNQMDEFKQAAMTMAKGGSVRKFNTGGFSFGNTPVGNLAQGNTGYSANQYSANPALTEAEKNAQTTAQQMADNDDDGPSVNQPVQLGPQVETVQYVPQGGPPISYQQSQQPLPQNSADLINPNISQTVQQNVAGTFDIVDASGKVIKTNIDTAEQAQQMIGQQ